MTDSDQKTKMRGIIGLANLGNTCYMNSALQALRHCPEWTLFCSKDRVDSYVKERDTKEAKVLFAYKDLLKSLWAGTGPAYVRPNGFFHELQEIVKGTLYDDFIQRTPQDAHEFLVWLLDQMYMATQNKVTIPVRELRNSEQSIRYKAVIAWKEAFENQYSPLTDLLFGLYKVTLRCQGCNAMQIRWETFNHLKVTPRPNMDLEECLKHELADEEIDDYRCDSCHEKAKQTKSIRLWRLPKVLILTLKRFTHMGTKDCTPIQYQGVPITLDSLFSSESEEPSRHKQYSVFASVDHHGRSLGGGHYTSQCLNPVWNSWHVYDDESAHPIQEPQFGQQSYILFFRQSSSPVSYKAKEA